MKSTKKTTKKKVYATHVTLPSGERLYLRGKTKAELEEKVLQAKMAVNAGVDITNTELFNTYARAWLKAYKAPPKLRQTSYDVLESNVRNHVLPFFEGMKLKDIKPLHIQLFRSAIADLSKSVQRKLIQTVRNIFDTAVENGLLLRSPVSKEDKPVGEETAEVEPLTQEQARRLLWAVKETRAYLFCLLALVAGLRRGELLGLMWEDIDFGTGTIHVSHNKAFLPNCNDTEVTTVLKTDAARRDIPLAPYVIEELREARAQTTSPYVFSMANGQSLSKSSFRKLWDTVKVRTATENRKLGSFVSGGREGPIHVTLDFECHPHMLRHTCITNWFEAGLDLKQVQYLAGHSKPDMTLRVYTHYRRKCRAAETAQQVSAASGYLAL